MPNQEKDLLRPTLTGNYLDLRKARKWLSILVPGPESNSPYKYLKFKVDL